MDSLRHGHPTQHIDTQPTGWTVINQPADQANKTLGMASGGPVALQTSVSAMPATKVQLGNSFKAPVANTPRALLPRPHPVPRTQPIKCPVCCRPDCILKSHQHFAEQIVAKRKTRTSATPTSNRTRARSQQTPPWPPEQAVKYPVAMDSERHQLLSLWSQPWSPLKRGPERHLFPTPWIDRVLPVARGHAALFQALLASSAATWTMVHAMVSEPATRQLQLANQTLSQTCTTHMDANRDECILAALLITAVYQAQGNAHETDKNFSHIVRLVGSRGGPQYLRMSGIVTDVLLYVDYLQAVYLDCEPVWSLPLPALQIGVHPRLGSGFRELLAANLFHADLLLAADSVCRTADIFEQASDAMATRTGAANSFGYLSTVSEYQLAHCNAVLHGSSTWNECICLALLLFNHIVLRHQGVITAPVRKIEHQFWQTVDSTIVRNGFRDVPPCMLLWLFVTGLSSCTLTDSQYRPLAVKRLRAARISAAVTGWEHFQKKVLDDFVWVRAAQESMFRDVWLEVEGQRGVS